MTAANVWAWIENFKYKTLALQNKKVANEQWKYFPTNFIFKIKLQLKGYQLVMTGQMLSQILSRE